MRRRVPLRGTTARRYKQRSTKSEILDIRHCRRCAWLKGAQRAKRVRSPGADRVVWGFPGSQEEQVAQMCCSVFRHRSGDSGWGQRACCRLSARRRHELWTAAPWCGCRTGTGRPQANVQWDPPPRERGRSAPGESLKFGVLKPSHTPEMKQFRHRQGEGRDLRAAGDTRLIVLLWGLPKELGA